MMHNRSGLLQIAAQAMLERGLESEFSPAVLQQLDNIKSAAHEAGTGIHDLRNLLWCSIDNDDSLDLDQLTVCEVLSQGGMRLWVAISDVDALVKPGTAIDAHAQRNTTSVYTSAHVFSMLPERLCNDLSSLKPHEDRLALVTEMVFNRDASLAGATVYRALVRNHAKLAYDAVSAWLQGQAALPGAAADVAGMEAQLRSQDALAQQLRARRLAEGALEFETFQPRAVFEHERVVDIRIQEHNRARQLIEEFMIATNGCTARYLVHKGRASLRRVVRSPQRWQRIVAVAREYGDVLPNEPDSKALEKFLAKRRRIDPLRFPDVSLVIVKLMGRGEYVVETPGSMPVGHFGLAVHDYTHSTAPNRRFPDLITLRLLKAALTSSVSPYSHAQLQMLAQHCTEQEDAAQKVERRMRKSEAALLLENRIGEFFDGIVTASSVEAMWVRVLHPPVEGKLLSTPLDIHVADRVRVKLLSVHVERGFIDFSFEGKQASGRFHA